MCNVFLMISQEEPILKILALGQFRLPQADAKSGITESSVKVYESLMMVNKRVARQNQKHTDSP